MKPHLNRLVDHVKASKESYVYFWNCCIGVTCGRKPTNHVTPKVQVVMLNWVKEVQERGEVLNATDQWLGGHINEQ